MSEEKGNFHWTVIPEEYRAKFADVMFKANPAQRQAIFDILYLNDIGALDGMTDEQLSAAVEKAMEELQ